jgi:hypothetical protein
VKDRDTRAMVRSFAQDVARTHVPRKATAASQGKRKFAGQPSVDLQLLPGQAPRPGGRCAGRPPGC